MDIKAIVGNYCKEFRLSLGMTLKDLSNASGIGIKTISAFEHGRSSNMVIIFQAYWNACDGDVELQKKFSDGLFKEL